VFKHNDMAQKAYPRGRTVQALAQDQTNWMQVLQVQEWLQKQWQGRSLQLNKPTLRDALTCMKS